MTLSISSILPLTPAQAASPELPLQPGTVVSAQVVARLNADLVRIAIGALTLDAATSLPLQPGQVLQLAVTKTSNGVSLAQVLPDQVDGPRSAASVITNIPLAPHLTELDDAGRAALSPAELRAVQVAAQDAAPRQAGLSPLFANLTTAAMSGRLPQPVLSAAAQVLGLRQPVGRSLNGADIKAAFASSGLLLESSRAAGPSSVGALPDMKAALTVLRQALSTWFGEPAARPPAPLPGQAATVTADFRQPQTAPAGGAEPGRQFGEQAARPISPLPGQASTVTTGVPQIQPVAAGRPELVGPARGAVLPIVGDAAPPLPPDGEPLASGTRMITEPAAAARQGLAADDAAPSARLALPPPFRGALPSAQPIAVSSIPPDAEPVEIARQLIADTNGALARQTLLQIASLPDRADPLAARSETMQPRWNFEIPFVTPQGTAMAQFEIARDGNNEAEAAQRVWRARFSLDIEPAGPVHALISFNGEATFVRMWAERPATAAQLRANAATLGASLGRADLKAGDIVVADGTPARVQSLQTGHFINRAS